MPTTKQTALLHVAKKRLGISDEDWRALLKRAAGVKSSADLDRAGFERMMETLHHLGFTSDFAKEHLGHRPGWATAAQHALIEDLWRAVTDGEGDAAGLDRWIAKRFGVSGLRFADAEIARKIIGGLKNWRARK